jgi:rhamnosyltransferase
MKIACIIVTYKPNLNILKKNIKNLRNSVDKFIIVDNTPKGHSLSGDKILNIKLEVNLGIAAAQNIALDYCLKNNFYFCMFNDQDTIFEKTYINKMIKNYYSLSYKKKVFALFPNLYDRNKKKLSGLVIRKGIYKKTLGTDQNNNSYVITESMSSGMIIKLNLIKKIGYLNENMFLDWVDFDFCWRALKKNFILVGFPNIIASHYLGDKKEFLFGRAFHIHNHIRCYYILRNGLNVVIYNKYIKFSWKLNILFNLIRYSFGYLYFLDNKYLTIKYIAKALLHGMTNKLGKLGYD